MASEPFETCWILPRILDGVDHGEIIQKDGASRSGTKLKASRASPQTSFGPRHSIASFFSASLAKLRTPPVPRRSRRSELACVCSICIICWSQQQHRLEFPLPPRFFFVLQKQRHCASPLQKGYHRHRPLSLFTAVISISSTISIYGNSLGVFGPPFCAWPPKL